MAAGNKIEQEFGIDVAQALAALKQLDSGYQTIEQRLNSVAASIQNFNRQAGVNNFGRAATQANTYNQALNRMATGFNNVNTAAQTALNTVNGFGGNVPGGVGRATRSVQDFNVSWETLSRVVQTQLIVRTMSAIRDALSEAVDEAIKFQKEVALIQTIAPDANFGQIAEQVRKLSDNFNIPLLEAAKGVYQAISNQVGDFGESLRFTEEAAKFAKATNSSLADSVDLLSGAIRSYGLSVEDTARISGIFFTAIDKGRVTAEQLANAFGRVGPAAQEVGITLEELSAAIATISDKGVKTSEALTQFRGIITALTKPTEAMSQKLAQLGFSSNESAIATLRLDGVLDALANSTDGSTTAFAKLFPNVRGIGGALSLTGENLKTFAENIREAKANGEDYANSKFAVATATDAERLTKALNQLSNAFTLELGQALVKVGAEFISVDGRVEFMVNSVKTLASAIPGVTKTVAALTLGLGALKLAALATASPMALLVSTAGALAVAIPSALQAIDDARTRNAFKTLTDLQAANKADLESFRKNQNDKLLAAKAVDDAVVQGALKRIQGLNRTYLEDVNNAKTSNKVLVADTERALDKIVSARTSFIAAIGQSINDSRQEIVDSLNRIENLKQRKQTRLFEFNTRDFSDAQKVFATTQRASETAANAEQLLRKAFSTGDDKLKQRALSLFDQADALGQQAQQIAQNTGNRALEVKAARDLEGTTNRQIAAEQRINQLQLVRQKQLQDERSKQEVLIQQIREQQKIVLENTGLFDKQNKLISPDQQQARTAKRGEALKKIAELAFSGQDFKAADALGLGTFVQSIENDLSQRPIKLVFDVESGIQKIEAQINQVFQNIDQKVPFLKQLEDVVGHSLTDAPEQISQGIREVASEAQGIRKTIADQANLSEEIIRKRGEIVSLIKSLEDRSAARATLNDQNPEAQQATLESIAKLKQLAESTDIDIGEVIKQVNTLASIDFGGQHGLLITDAKLLSEAFVQVDQLAKKLESQSLVQPADLERLQQLDSVLKSIGADTLLNDVSSSATLISNSVQPIATIETSALQTATYYERAATAIERIANAQLPAVPVSVGAEPVANQYGRMARYFASGGFARGVDTIPAMLRKGESVINPSSTARFFSQIQAINAGQTPVFRQDGGSVTTNVGDININVNGSKAPEATARQVMQKMRRELKRGTGRL